MTRARPRRWTDPKTAWAFDREYRPPAEQLPKSMSKLILERDDIRKRLTAAQRELRDLTTGVGYSDGWKVEEAKAKKADAEAAVAAARVGKTVDNPTAHLDALVDRKNRVETQVDGLKGAQKQVLRELFQVRENERQNPKYNTDVEAATAALKEALEVVAQRAADLGRTKGLAEWLHDQEPYDASTDLFLHDVWPRSTITLGTTGDANEPVPLDDVINAIANL